MSSGTVLSSYTSSAGSRNQGEDEQKRTQQLPTPTIFDKEIIQSLPRQYIITQLVENGYSELATGLGEVPNPDDQAHNALKEIASALDEERREQFRDMLITLAPTETNLKPIYDTITSEMFKGKTHWGKVVTFIVFTSHLVLHCAEKKTLRGMVPEIVEWSDAVIKERLHDWIQEQGGWQAFLEHYDVENWQVSLSTGMLALGATAMVVGGLLATVKRFFF